MMVDMAEEVSTASERGTLLRKHDLAHESSAQTVIRHVQEGNMLRPRVASTIKW